ncbi:glycosyltransferase [Paenibacillus pinistramenti]|uniref:glycosyltransferase n=1 Tax=Paenibacillus pinistramenti TaxID=1768003 RepID=UPI0011098477|nr:glycosyltransferase [Paenibacillus pinistramenti]
MDFTGERFIPGKADIELEVEHLHRYEILREFVKGKRVLDAACGEGYGSYLLSETAESVTGIDISPVSVADANEKYIRNNLQFIEASIADLPFSSASFDVVVSFETLEHVDGAIQDQFMTEVKRILVRDGAFIISTPNKKYYSDLPEFKNPYHIKELYKDEFLDLLSNHFNNVSIANQRYEVASIISESNIESAVFLNTDNSFEDLPHEKYMIAFCSDTNTGDFPFSSFRIYKGKYEQLTTRVLNLQEEVEERNNHIEVLDREIDYLRTIYTRYKELTRVLKIEEVMTADENKEFVLNLQSKHEAQNQKISRELEEIKSCLESTRIELNNKKSHINLLLEKDRELNNIYDSAGWKLLMNYYKFRDWLIPANSKRRVISKLAVKTLKHPKLMLSKLNRSNIKKLKYYLETEEGKRVEGRIDSYMDRHVSEAADSARVQLFKIDEYRKLVFRKYADPAVSIIIPVYNQWNYTYSCLVSILQNTLDIPYEVIIADDMSTDETVNIAQYVENITVVRDGINRGFLLNCNHAAKAARGKYLFFLNNDTNVQADWLSSLLEVIESDASVGMVGSKLVYPDGRLQEAGGIIWNDASGWNYGRLDDPGKPEYNYLKEVDYISGAAILVRHTIWQELGGFDERYVPAYFEDTDLAFEVRRLGYKVILQPKSVIVHFEGISHGTDTNSGIKSYQVTNKEKFMDKWKEELSRDQFSNAEHVFWARDRSRNKKTIVVVDHYVPHFDKDAGSRATYFYLKLFASMDFHVIFIGDNFFKHEPYTSKLKQLGIEVLYGDYYARNINKWIKTNGAYIDYVYLNRPHISVKYMEIFKNNTSAKMIYFGHDLHFLREMRNYELTKNPNLIKSSEEWKKIEFSLFNDADVIHVVGSYEQSFLQKEFANKPIRNIPLFPYEQLYAEDHDIETFDSRKDLLFVGGFNHTPNYDGILWFLNEVFNEIKKQLPDVKLYIVGSNPPEDLKARSTDDVIVTGFVSDEELERYYNRSRLVIVPLRYGAGVKGKLVEALYYQVPVITTSIGSEGLEEPEKVMTIADDAQKFAHSVIQLYQDESKWRASSEASGQYIAKYFTCEAARSILALDFE